MGARLLWIVLDDMTSRASMQPYPGQERLGEYLGCSARHVRTLLNELQEAGWLAVTHRGVTKTNLYTLTKPVDNHRNSTSDRNSSSGQERNSTSGHERNHSSYEAEPVEAEPVEAHHPSQTRNPRGTRNETGEGGWGFKNLNQEDTTAVATARQAGWTDTQIADTAEQCRQDPTIRSPRGVWRHRLTNEDPPRPNPAALVDQLIAWAARGRPEGLVGPAADLLEHKPVRDACRYGSADDIRRTVTNALATEIAA